MLFVFYGFEPLDCGGGVFLLVEFGCSYDFAVDSMHNINVYIYILYIYIYIYIYIDIYIYIKLSKCPPCAIV